jgi:hypothetical protein
MRDSIFSSSLPAERFFKLQYIFAIRINSGSTNFKPDIRKMWNAVNTQSGQTLLPAGCSALQGASRIACIIQFSIKPFIKSVGR